MRYTAINYMGSTPATSYQNSKLICLNADLFFTYPPEIRKFIALHEEGHIKLDTDSEIEADNYAFDKYKGHSPASHRWSILSFSRVLPFINKEQYKRLINMYQKALIADSYETGASISYEMSYLNQLNDDVDQMNDQEWQDQNNTDPVSGEVTTVQKRSEPVGEYVNIARETWIKAKLGDELTGYDLTILDKYPIPADFEAYAVDPAEIIGATAIPPATGATASTPATDPATSIPATAKKLPLWVWLTGAGIILLLIIKR